MGNIRYQRTAHRITSAVNCRPLKPSPRSICPAAPYPTGVHIPGIPPPAKFATEPLFPSPVHRPQQRWRLCAAQQRDRERLEQLKTIDKMHDELEGDLSRLVVLHDIERWKGLPVVKELEGF